MRWHMRFALKPSYSGAENMASFFTFNSGAEEPDRTLQNI